MIINHYINKLIQYGIDKLLIDEEDRIFIANKLIEMLGIESFREEKILSSVDLYETLNTILDYAFENGIIEGNDSAYRDMLDAKMMDLFVSRPSEIIRKFYQDYKLDPVLATDRFYRFCQEINYIRMDRIQKNVHWKSQNEFGVMDLTINLSKPEKDPKTIALAKQMRSTGYPKCLLCKENVGFKGHLNHPARQNHRIIPIEINNEKFYFQYSPYIYYNEHAIVLHEDHVDMEVNAKTFRRLTDFVEMFPGYFLGSNAGLPIVGGSILDHEHYQGGKYRFPIEDAGILKYFLDPVFPNCKIEMLKWPCSTIRIKTKKKEELWELADRISTIWGEYEDAKANVIPFTNHIPHNAITPICRLKDGTYEIDIVLRNNRTTQDFPDGLFHPHRETHHIKKENIGLIEVMGLAVLPGRLLEEIAEIENALARNESIREEIIHHKQWVEYLRGKLSHPTDLKAMIRDEVGKKFLQALLDTGVFKQSELGIEHFVNFMKACGFEEKKEEEQYDIH